MQTTRRTFLEGVGAVAALGAIGASPAATARPLIAQASTEKCRFWVAAVTPCDKNLQFEEVLYRDMLAYFKQNGADGVVVLGSTGEYPSFSMAERKKIAETALKHRDGLNIVISTGTSNFPETIELSQHAAVNGADGLLIIPPFYFKEPPLEGLLKYYSLIFEQVSIPVSLYHYPRMSAVPVTPNLLHSLEKYPNLAGMKDSSGDTAGYQQYVKEFPKLNITTGTPNNLKRSLETGMGAILATDGNLLTGRLQTCSLPNGLGKTWMRLSRDCRTWRKHYGPVGSLAILRRSNTH